MKIAYRAPNDAARDLSAAWKRDGGDPHVRPHNFYDGDEGRLWWIVPSSDWPAFRLGKVIVRLAEPDSVASLLVGLHVEKGLGNPAAAAGYSDNRIMDPSWRWYALQADVRSGRLARAIATAAKALQEPLLVRVKAHVPVKKEVPVKKSRSDRPPSEDIILFECGDGRHLSLKQEPQLGTDERYLEIASGVRTLGHLRDVLDEVANSPWVWIDLSLGCSFIASSSTDGIQANEVWSRLLKPFLPWLR